ncbi:MAG: hypothetical protein IJ866_02360 [Alphaproteobacteria bacterium]|nr:hypothetical protein [Alphaproteobacteria bacterium]
MAMDKRTWANIALGTVAVIAIVFGVKQCSDKRAARDEAQEWHTLVSKNNTALTDASNAVEAANGRISELNDENSALRDTIVVRDSTIADLRDSLAVCREAKACACQGNKTGCDCKDAKNKCDCCKCEKPAKQAKKPAKPAKKPAKPAKPAQPVKPAKPAPVKPAQPAKSAPVKPTPCPEQKTEIVATPDTVVVRTNAHTPTQTVVITGDNNGNVIVNANGVVNANGNVNGHDNNVNTTEPQKKKRLYQNACRTTTTVVLGSRSKCY